MLTATVQTCRAGSENVLTDTSSRHVPLAPLPPNIPKNCTHGRRTGLSDAPRPGFLQMPYQVNGELIERALCLYDAGLNPSEAAHDMFGVVLH